MSAEVLKRPNGKGAPELAPLVHAAWLTGGLDYQRAVRLNNALAVVLSGLEERIAGERATCR